MKILVYADVHGNKYALEELYKSDDYHNADLRIFLGDAFALRPYPNECLDELIRILVGGHVQYLHRHVHLL